MNGAVKLSVCAYRPWIRDSRIVPAGDSKVAATGYSFPSGHTMCATAMYGTTAVWQRKKRKWLAIRTCLHKALKDFFILKINSQCTLFPGALAVVNYDHSDLISVFIIAIKTTSFIKKQSAFPTSFTFIS